MGSVTIAHIIGTVTLLIIFSTVSTYYAVSYSYLQSKIMISNLRAIADYVSSEIIDLFSLCSLSAEIGFLVQV